MLHAPSVRPEQAEARRFTLQAAAIAALYAVVLLALVDVRPFWLDELIQLQGTFGTTSRALVQHVLSNPGGAPLGYLIQHWLLSLADSLSRTAARMPSVIAGTGSLISLIVLARRLGLSRPALRLAAGLWIVCPLALRYSLEGRPYMQGVLFGMLAVLAQLQLRKKPSIGWALALAASLCGALYSQPFAIFAPLGFSACSIWQSRQRRHAMLAGAAWGVAGLSFVPWMVAANAHWVEHLAQRQFGFQPGPSLLLVLLRECVGDGYLAALPIALFAAYCCREVAAHAPRRDSRTPLLAAILSGIVLALAADAAFDYFFAIRQVIYILPFLLLIAADTACNLWNEERRRMPAAILVLAFLGASAAKDWRYFADRREDWERLAATLVRDAQDGCVLLPAGDSAGNYRLFQPGIADRLCGGSLSARRIVMPVHRYTDARASAAAEGMLHAKHMRRTAVNEIGFARIECFERADQLE